jgi:hypothetical protein
MPAMSTAPSPELLLAAIERAETHRTQRVPGVALTTLLEHLDISRRSHQARQVRAQLDALAERGALERLHPRYGTYTWTLTRTGRRRLNKARRAGVDLTLPESPQHRKWRNARTLAEEEIDRFRSQLRDALKEARALLDAEPPTDSQTWIATSRKVQIATWRLAPATHCLYEWPEPQEDRPDTPDPHHHPGLRNILI